MSTQKQNSNHLIKENLERTNELQSPPGEQNDEGEKVDLAKNGEGKEKILFRSKEDYMLAGVLGGLAEFWNRDSTILRVLFLISIILTAGITIIVYFILAKIIPLEPEDYVVIRESS